MDLYSDPRNTPPRKYEFQAWQSSRGVDVYSLLIIVKEEGIEVDLEAEIYFEVYLCTLTSLLCKPLGRVNVKRNWYINRRLVLPKPCFILSSF